MARLEDPRLVALFQEALSEWQVSGYVVWKRIASEWVAENLEGHTTRSIARIMYEFFRSGGEIDQVRERRPEYASRYEHHYDFRLEIDGRRIYIETVLDETRTGPEITIVSIHDA